MLGHPLGIHYFMLEIVLETKSDLLSPSLIIISKSCLLDMKIVKN